MRRIDIWTQGLRPDRELERRERPVEFHLYEKGRHGFGMGISRTTTVD
jgi:hypothetical protein